METIWRVMTKDTLLKSAFIISYLLTFAGIILKMLHYPGAEAILIACVVATVVYIIIALYEIYNSDRITVSEKRMWTVGLIFLSGITGLLYYFIGRQRILRDYKILQR